MSNSKPVSHVSIYPVSAAIWRNPNDKGEAFYNVTFKRTYKDEKGKWQNSVSFNAGDPLLLAKVADLAHSEIVKLRASDHQPHESEE
jgi:hypothetical protein